MNILDAVDNMVIATGRLAADPQIKANADGSRRVYFTLMVDAGTKNEKPVAYAHSFEAFLSKDQKTNACYPYMKKGSLVRVAAEHRSAKWVDKTTNEKRYKEFDFVLGVKFLESKATTEAREKRRTEGEVKPAEIPDSSSVNLPDEPTLIPDAASTTVPGEAPIFD